MLGRRSAQRGLFVRSNGLSFELPQSGVIIGPPSAPKARFQSQ
jgi:hypothetical protein